MGEFTGRNLIDLLSAGDPDRLVRQCAGGLDVGVAIGIKDRGSAGITTEGNGGLPQHLDGVYVPNSRLQLAPGTDVAPARHLPAGFLGEDVQSPEDVGMIGSEFLDYPTAWATHQGWCPECVATGKEEGP